MFQIRLINKQLYIHFIVRECLIRVLTFLPNFSKMENVFKHRPNCLIWVLSFKSIVGFLDR